MNLLVNIISDQTIHNVQFIKQFYNEGDEILFITTPTMEQKGVGDWILKSLSIEGKVHRIEVNPFDLKEMRKKLNEFDTDEYDDVLVNITGGTKTMSLTVFDLFKNKGADIYYLSGKGQYFRIFPEKKKNEFQLDNNITLSEYLIASGFEIVENSLSGIPEDYTQYFFDWAVNKKTYKEHNVIKKLQNKIYMKNGYDISKKDIALRTILEDIKFPCSNFKLTALQVRYLTGGWFEEYVYFNIAKLFNIDKDNIKTGIELTRGMVKNEFDVAFLLKGHLHLIECKTYITSKQKPSLPSDTIYKSASLIKQMGIFAHSYIFTLTETHRVNKQTHDRAKLMNIKLFMKEQLQSIEVLQEAFKNKL